MFVSRFLRSFAVVLTLVVGLSTSLAQSLRSDIEEEARELLFIADDVPEQEILLSGVRSGVRSFVLKGGDNFFEEIAAEMRNYRNVDAVHIVSHGQRGTFAFGDRRIRADELDQKTKVLSEISKSLSDGSDLLLYGCELAQGARGREYGALIEVLARSTGADLAASKDLTGGASDANWELEVHKGKIETELAFDKATRQAWRHSLINVSEPPDFTNNLNNSQTFTLDSGSNRFSGRVETGAANDGQDNFRVQVPNGFHIASVHLSLNTGGGFSGFAAWNLNNVRSSTGFFGGGVVGAGIYQVQVAGNFAVGNNWVVTIVMNPNCSGAASCSDGNECTDDVCNPTGNCTNPVRSAGTPCGSAADTTCTNPDSCNASGVCQPNHASNGTSCEAGAFCTDGDSCSAGQCVEGAIGVCQADEKCDEVIDECYAACGDAVLDPGEECDNGASNSDVDADACRLSCVLAACGDGTTDSSEDCDDSGNSATCDSDCTTAVCGDSFLNPIANEDCDDGGNSATCDSDCTPALCGDSFTNPVANEECDDSGNSATCDSDCTTAVCGDNFLNPIANEDCDDGGNSATCDSDCTPALCGDSFTNPVANEECDDSGNSATCDSDCTAAICGDGFVNSAAAISEECDDSNSESGDACNSTCKLDSDEDTISDEDETDDTDLSTPAPDTDEDETEDYLDLDSDGDTISDSHEAGDDDLMTPPVDSDEDELPDYRDADSDNDGVSDAEEAGDEDLGTAPVDTDADGIPDYLDTDSDNDDVEDGDDNCRLVANTEQVDTNEDGAGDECQDDDDGDGVLDGEDNCQFISNPQQGDLDGDGAGDNCDSDEDGDGFEDDLELSGSGCACNAGNKSSGLSYLAVLLVFLMVARPHRRMRNYLGLFSLLLLCLSPALSHAQINRNVELERFRLASDSEGVMDVEGAESMSTLKWNLSLWMGAAFDPLLVRRQRDGSSMELGSLVADRFSAELGGAIGLGHGFQIAAALPLLLDQSQDEIAGAPSGLASRGIGDLRISPKYQFMNSQDSGLAMAVLATIYVPSASDDAFLGEEGMRFAPTFAISQQLSNFRLVGNLGYMMRENRKLANLRVRDELQFRAGAGYLVNPRSKRPLELSLTGAIATQASSPFETSAQSPLELMAGANYKAAESVGLFAGMGAGLVQGIGTPAWRAMTGIRWQSAKKNPRGILVVDSDGDGIVDEDDQCPKEPEDIDGFEDSDGCPDVDHDIEGELGLVDKVEKDESTEVEESDKCATTSSEEEGVSDRYGCPDEPKEEVVKSSTKPQARLDPSQALPPPIEFEIASAVLRTQSDAMLDRLAQILQEYPEVKLLEVQGHTSSDGSANFNRKLSKERAQAVVDALVQRGVDVSRLKARGYGSSRPLVQGDSEADREKNRRVQFHILKRD